MSTERDTTLDVRGMTCGACVSHVSEALESIAGVDEVDVDLDRGTVIVRHDPASAPVNRLIGALQKAGYDSSPRNV